MVVPTSSSKSGSTVLALVLIVAPAAAACAPTDVSPTSSPTTSHTTSSAQPPTSEPGSPSMSPTATPGPSTHPTPAPTPTPTPPFVADTSPDRGAAQGGPVGYLTDIRLGAHTGYDRVVFEYSGPGTPAWHVRYVDQTVADPSGSPYLVRGDAFLEATLFGVEYPDPGAPDAFDGPFILSIPSTRSVVEVIQSSVFEGQMQTFIGVSPRALPFRAFRLGNPSRVVIDVLQAP